ncbi:MAG: tetratricopeptide repeat protein [Patescibacteria group bacterium]
MLFYQIFGAIIGICVLAAVIIIARKFPQISLIDVESIPLERDAKKKREIVIARVDRIAAGWVRKFLGTVRPVAQRIQASFRRLYRRALVLERQLERSEPVLRVEIRARVNQLLTEGAQFFDAGDAAGAERRFIDAIALDARNLEAYRGLIEIYLLTKQYAEARETSQFLLKIVRAGRERAKDFLNLGLACGQMGDPAAAVAAFEEAVAREPMNPKHLDLLLEACILKGNKGRALEVFELLKTANPDNQKLESLAQIIAAMPAAATKRGRKVNTPT